MAVHSSFYHEKNSFLVEVFDKSILSSEEPCSEAKNNGLVHLFQSMYRAVRYSREITLCLDLRDR